MSLPLKGLLVVALEQAVAAPFCTAQLADAGARVIKIERSTGDFARHYDQVVNGESAYFVWLNRGKESICLDIKDVGDATLLHRIIDNADIFVQNLAPGATERAGLASKKLRGTNERLITLDISGYGTGPYRDMKAYDFLVQCESGLASITGGPDEPGRVGVSVCDIACGMYAHAAVLQALIEREQTGLGQGIAVSLFDALADWMSVPLFHQDAGAAPKRVGLNHPSIAPYGAYDCGDGHRYVIAIQNNREWRSFCENVLQKPHLTNHSLYKDNVSRCANRDPMNLEIDTVFATLDSNQLKARFELGRIAYGTVNSVADFANHPHLRRITIDTPGGSAAVVAPPAVSTQGEVQFGAVPALGEHTDEIRQEFSSAKG